MPTTTAVDAVTKWASTTLSVTEFYFILMGVLLIKLIKLAGCLPVDKDSFEAMSET